MISSSSRLSSNIAIYRLEPVGTLSGDLGPCVLQRLPRFVRWSRAPQDAIWLEI
jgi:hypothetical protein